MISSLSHFNLSISLFKYAETRLDGVTPEEEEAIRSQFTKEKYGATMMKMGWNVYNWLDSFEVMDVARRVDSGVGSYGVDRYYVLLKGDDRTPLEGDQCDKTIILDVKHADTPAWDPVLSKEDKAWYNVLFQNDAERAVLAQRKLTSYVDPFTGWITLDGKWFYVRERSPWKLSPALQTFSSPADFIEFAEQIARSTATSHARGTVSKSPGQFKHGTSVTGTFCMSPSFHLVQFVNPSILLISSALVYCAP